MLLRSRKGISPLIAAVLLIAFTISVGSIVGPWFSSTIQDMQERQDDRADTILDSTQTRIEVLSSRYDKSTGSLLTSIKNSGSTDLENLTVSVLSENKPVQVQLNRSLAQDEITNVEINVSEPETVIVDSQKLPVRARKDVEKVDGAEEQQKEKILIDSFESGDLSDYSGDKGNFEVVEGGADGNYALEITHPAYEETNNFIWRENKSDFSQGSTLRWYSDGSAAWQNGLTFGLESKNNGYATWTFPDEGLYLYRFDDGNRTKIGEKSADIQKPYYSELKWEEDGTIKFQIYETEAYENVNTSVTATDPTYSGEDIGWYVDGLMTWDGLSYYDNLRRLNN